MIIPASALPPPVRRSRLLSLLLLADSLLDLLWLWSSRSMRLSATEVVETLVADDTLLLIFFFFFIFLGTSSFARFPPSPILPMPSLSIPPPMLLSLSSTCRCFRFIPAMEAVAVVRAAALPLARPPCCSPPFFFAFGFFCSITWGIITHAQQKQEAGNKNDLSFIYTGGYT